jgi:hypothetical protein
MMVDQVSLPSEKRNVSPGTAPVSSFDTGVSVSDPARSARRRILQADQRRGFALTGRFQSIVH